MAQKTIDIKNRDYTDRCFNYFKYEPESVCPVCKRNLSPAVISSMAYEKQDEDYVCILNYCTGCNSPFISTYKVVKRMDSTTTFVSAGLIGSEPNRFTKQEFDAKVSNLSPQFDKIYNQALAADVSGLDEIAGLGYRKALEFLIKDFAIHEHPDDEEKIKANSLSKCIKNYIDADHIKTLAERSAWIGNDEAHYIRKQEDRDVSDMKAFIQATVYFIAMVLITEDASSMTPK